MRHVVYTGETNYSYDFTNSRQLSSSAEDTCLVIILYLYGHSFFRPEGYFRTCTQTYQILITPFFTCTTMSISQSWTVEWVQCRVGFNFLLQLLLLLLARRPSRCDQGSIRVRYEIRVQLSVTAVGESFCSLVKFLSVYLVPKLDSLARPKLGLRLLPKKQSHSSGMRTVGARLNVYHSWITWKSG